MNRLLLVWIIEILLVVETFGKSKCKKKPCGNTNSGYGTNHEDAQAGPDIPTDPHEKKIALIIGGASIALIFGIIFCVWSKCCGLCKKKTPLQPIEE